MKVNKIIKNIKKINPEIILLVKMGEFYFSYGKDSYILAYLFKYKIRMAEENIPVCAFPRNSLNKVLTILEEKDINYLIVDKCLNYEVLEEYKIKEDKYKDIFEQANKYIKKKNRIDNIYRNLISKINEDNIKEKIEKVEKIVNEI